MQISILGVPFKCTKDMFSQESVIVSACIFWAVLWRYALSLVGLGLVVMMTIGTSGALANSFGSFVGMVVAFLFAALLIGAYLFMLGYWQYYGLYKKRYKTFDKLFTTVEPTIKFFTWQFWKPYLIVLGIGFVFSVLVEVLVNHGVNLVNLLFSLFLMHISFHSGTWGFVPAPTHKPANTN